MEQKNAAAADNAENNTEAIEKNPRKMTVLGWLARILQGAIIGGGAILPGVSGGVLCVSFGLYQPMMSLLAHPVQKLPMYWRMFLPVGIGWVFGFFVFAKLIEVVFRASEVLAVCLFVGLIIGTVPSLMREAGKEGRNRASWISMAVAFALMMALMLYIKYGLTAEAVEPAFGWFLLSGGLWGLSLVVPGLTSSSFMICLGLLEPMAAGVAAFDFGVILPMLLGIAVILLALSRLVNSFFESHWSVACHAIVGIVLASTLAIVPLSYGGWGQGLAALGCAVVGAAVAIGMDKLGNSV